jgi:1-acyl-sn-glycerol-3-phosphate acyltransferase
MNFEMPERLNNPEAETKKRAVGQLAEGEKPDAFTRKMELFGKLLFSKVNVAGEENFAAIPPDRQVMFVTTHLTNFDIPLASSVLGKKFHLAVGDASTNHHFLENPFGTVGDVVAGRKNFIPISRRKGRTKGASSAGIFDPEDFEKIGDAFGQNKAVVISAYYKDRNDELKLPPRGGYGAAYLAEATDAIVVPVAIDIKAKERKATAVSDLAAALDRPEAKITIGKPFELEKMENISAVRDIMAKRQREKLSGEDIAAFKGASRGLRDRSNVLMQHLAELLPEEKRGEWTSARPEK